MWMSKSLLKVAESSLRWAPVSKMSSVFPSNASGSCGLTRGLASKTDHRKKSNENIRNNNDKKNSSSDSNNSENLASEWVKFQQSIKVDGFETGQTLTNKTFNRRGKQKNARNELEETLKERQRLSDAGGGMYPPLRYSEEETERLLREAYSMIPHRDGKRGTRNLKRQARRWHLVRQIRDKQKYHLANHQTRKMEKRHQKVVQVKAVLEEAPKRQEQDKEYQLKVAQAWMERMQINSQQSQSVQE